MDTHSTNDMCEVPCENCEMRVTSSSPTFGTLGRLVGAPSTGLFIGLVTLCSLPFDDVLDPEATYGWP